LTAASCPKKDFYTPPPRPKKAAKSWQKGSKKGGKKGGQKGVKKRLGCKKGSKKRQQKSLFLNLSCCCLETGLKTVLLKYKRKKRDLTTCTL